MEVIFIQIAIILFTAFIVSSMLKALKQPIIIGYIIAGMIVLFFIGIKDDIISLAPYKKALGQLAAAVIIVIPGDIHLTCFYGVFGSVPVEMGLNFLFSIFILMVLINSINFIDGIDGLASGVGIIASLVLGIWYLINDQTSYSVICFSLTGSLLAFFYYNVFGKRNKIFLGDTGSMLIGFLLGVLIIYFLELNSIRNNADNAFKTAPSLSLAILFIPIFDTFRISLIRIYHRKSIFVGDCNHIHHNVLRLTGTHLKSTLALLFINLLIIAFAYLFRSLGNKILIIIIVILGCVFSLILGASVKHNSKI